jgi:hypothetical protein
VQPQAQPPSRPSLPYRSSGSVTTSVERRRHARSIERASFALGAPRRHPRPPPSAAAAGSLLAATKHERALRASRAASDTLESSRCARKPRLWRFGREEVTAI